MDSLVVSSNMILLPTLDLYVGLDDLDLSDNVVSAVINLFASRRYLCPLVISYAAECGRQQLSRYRSSALQRCYVRIR